MELEIPSFVSHVQHAHTCGEQTFACPICSKIGYEYSVTPKTNLLTHLQNGHEDLWEASIGRQSSENEECDSAANYLSSKTNTIHEQFDDGVEGGGVVESVAGAVEEGVGDDTDNLACSETNFVGWKKIHVFEHKDGGDGLENVEGDASKDTHIKWGFGVSIPNITHQMTNDTSMETTNVVTPTHTSRVNTASIKTINSNATNRRKLSYQNTTNKSMHGRGATRKEKTKTRPDITTRGKNTKDQCNKKHKTNKLVYFPLHKNHDPTHDPSPSLPNLVQHQNLSQNLASSDGSHSQNLGSSDGSLSQNLGSSDGSLSQNLASSDSSMDSDDPLLTSSQIMPVDVGNEIPFRLPTCTGQYIGRSQHQPNQMPPTT
eukprot:TRINITY_DN4141_c0_g2_i1.p1 TRINITY_DN4141_c0_g2~~TRINITY_DN4141_c0_g2_i1.p1  ORF type:complete len:373 (+),score=73.91 TRINITY_DN4141_c0_g2_i1:404-1522(+)